MWVKGWGLGFRVGYGRMEMRVWEVLSFVVI